MLISFSAAKKRANPCGTESLPLAKVELCTVGLFFSRAKVMARQM